MDLFHGFVCYLCFTDVLNWFVILDIMDVVHGMCFTLFYFCV